MNLNTITRRLFVSLLIVALAIACDKEDDPASQDDSVSPVDFLAGTDYTSLRVEIAYVEGFQPTDATVQNLLNFLSARLNKPAGIDLVQHRVASSGATSITADLLRQIESEQRINHTNGSNITAYFYFADADYAGNSGSSKTLGVAYGHSSMAVFEKSVREFAGGVGEPSVTTLESTVILHEFAHVLGLVNTGTPLVAQHHDAAHGGHCTNEDCLMYYLAETSGIAGNLFGGAVPGLDANCLADLKANGGK